MFPLKCRHAPTNAGTIIAATGNTTHTTTLGNPVCVKRFHRYYNRATGATQPTLQRDCYCIYFVYAGESCSRKERRRFAVAALLRLLLLIDTTGKPVVLHRLPVSCALVRKPDSIVHTARIPATFAVLACTDPERGNPSSSKENG